MHTLADACPQSATQSFHVAASTWRPLITPSRAARPAARPSPIREAGVRCRAALSTFRSVAADGRRATRHHERMTPRRPHWVYDAGDEPDPRFSLANEHAFLA